MESVSVSAMCDAGKAAKRNEDHKAYKGKVKSKFIYFIFFWFRDRKGLFYTREEIEARKREDGRKPSRA